MNYTVCGRQLLFVEDDEKLKKEMIAYFPPSIPFSRRPMWKKRSIF